MTDDGQRLGDPHRLGDVLAFAEHSALEAPVAPWQPLTTRISEEALHGRVAELRARLRSPAGGPIDERTAAATEQFALVARLVAAHVCATALGFAVSLSPEDVWWRQPSGALTQLSVTRATRAQDPLRSGVIWQLTTTVRRVYGVSPQVLWGNVGSAANSTVTLLRAARADLVEPARAPADAILRDPRVDGGMLRTGPGFRRRSCCLIHRAGVGLCGDCVLRH